MAKKKTTKHARRADEHIEAASKSPADSSGDDRLSIEPISLDSLPQEQVDQLIRAHMEAHVYDGGAVDGDPPLLAFRLRDPSAASLATALFIPWVWEGFFGTSLTITFGWRGAEPAFQSRVFFPQGSKVADRILSSRVFYAICLRRDAPEMAFKITLPIFKGTGHSLKKQARIFRTRIPAFTDTRAHFWETLEGNWAHQFSAEHLLSLSWMQAYRDYLDMLRHALKRWKNAVPAEQRRSGELPPVLLPIFGLVENLSGLIEGANTIFNELLANEAQNGEFMKAVKSLGPAAEGHDSQAWIPLDILSVHLWSSHVTEEGTRLPWLRFPNKGVGHVVLNAEALDARDSAKDYWHRILAMHGPLIIDWGLLIDGKDVPLSPATLSRTLSSMRKVRQGSPKSIEKDAKRTLSNAAVLSHRNAVERAIVPLKCGPLVTAEFVQSMGDVLVVWRTVDGEFAVFAVDPELGTWSTLRLWLIAHKVSRVAMARFESTAKLLIAETIRDLRSVGDSGLLEPSRWQPFPLESELDLLNHESGSRPGYHWSVWRLDRVRPSDVYVYMKARFGEPNGAMSALRRPVSDNLFHWQFNVAVEDELLMIIAGNTRIECRASTKTPLSLAEQQLIGLRLKNDFRNHNTAMADVRDDLESWMLFTNPYAQLTQTIIRAESKLAKISVHEPPAAPFVFDTQEDAERVMRRRVEWFGHVREAFELSMMIRVMAPIWGESFVNLMLLILRNAEVRDDDRLYQDLLRRQIDIRIRDLHRYCVGFRCPVNTNHLAFRGFLALMNARNDLLHGNVDPARLHVDSVLFDGTVPLFSEQRSLEATLSSQLFRPEYVNEARQAIETVRAFTDYVLSCLESRHGFEMRVLLGVNPLGFRKKTQRFGVLFGAREEMILVKATEGGSIQ